MSRKSYAAALDDVLKPMGFTRCGKWWSRSLGTVLEQVDLQTSTVAGATANLWFRDLETDRILQAIACETPLSIIQFGMRIGHLMDGYDHWWRNDPNGPAELAEAVRVHAEPWFDKHRSLEDQAEAYGRHGFRPWRSSNLPALAVTLYRLGALDEALALFDAPVPKTASATHVLRCRCALRWLEGKKREPSGPDEDGEAAS